METAGGGWRQKMKIEKDKRMTECTHLLLLRNWPLDGESIKISSYKRGKGNSLNGIKMQKVITGVWWAHAMHLIFIKVFFIVAAWFVLFYGRTTGPTFYTWTKCAFQLNYGRDPNQSVAGWRLWWGEADSDCFVNVISQTGTYCGRFYFEEFSLLREQIRSFSHMRSHLQAARYDLPSLVCSRRAAGRQVAYSPTSYPARCYWLEIQARYPKTDTWQHVQHGRKNNNYKKGKIATHAGSLQLLSHISDGSHWGLVTLYNSCPPLTLCQVSPAGQFFSLSQHLLCDFTQNLV